MHMISKKDLNSAEWESPMTVKTDNGEVQTHEEATFYVRELDMFLTMKLLEDTSAVMSLGKLCDEHGFSCEWINCQNHISCKMVLEYSAIRKNSYQSWFLVYLQLFQTRLPQHPRLLQITKVIIQISIQQSSQVNVWIDKNGEIRSLLKHQKSFYINQTHPKSKNKKNEESRTGTRRDPCSDIPEWFQEFRENLVDERVPEHRKLIREFFSWTIFRAYEKCGFGQAQCLYSFPECPKLRDVPEDQKSQGLRAENVLVESNLVQNFLLIWLQPITHLSVKGVNLETIIDMQSWCKTWLPNGSSRIRAKQKLLGKPKVVCKSSWSRIGSLKSFTLTIPWNLAQHVKIFPGLIARQHHTDHKQMGLLREQCAEWKKVCLRYCCNQVWMKIGGQIPWNVILICETFKISCLMGRPTWKTFWKTF